MSFYDATVPAYLQVLNSLSGLLTKAEAHCTAKKIAPEVLLNSRLYPDMLPLSKQIQLASDFATRGCARVTHSEVPQTPDTEKTFEELRARLAKTADRQIGPPVRRRVEGLHPVAVCEAKGPGALHLQQEQFLGFQPGQGVGRRSRLDRGSVGVEAIGREV